MSLFSDIVSALEVGSSGHNVEVFSLHFSPILSQSLLLSLIVISCILLAYALWHKQSGALLRSLFVFCVLLYLFNPSLLQKQKEPVANVLSIVVDESQSQKMQDRQQLSEQALQHLLSTIKDQDRLEHRVIRAPLSNNMHQETELFKALDNSLSDIPVIRRAGVIFISDGQIHDIPRLKELYTRYGPVHLFLSGNKSEKDRRITITQAPAYGITGQNVSLRYKVEDTPNIKQSHADIFFEISGKPIRRYSIEVGQEQEIEIPIDHAGQNIVTLSTPVLSDEISPHNNKTAILVHGVRDRLKVLLVSGRPHAGGRTWRDLLTSDPGADLVHFTILREPHKLDSTPQNELALIAFPFKELFEEKLYDFDLIIFDRYKLNRILPQNYFFNIAQYVLKGGALLEASGPSYAGDDSIYNTPLMDVLPDAPAENILKASFKPTISQKGALHPVTRDLSWHGGDNWGPWLRQVAVKNIEGDVLMTGIQDNPLLILNHVKEGRVAHITSDHIWLWSRGYKGGGPHAELLRRVVHWLMKEPELDERALKISVDRNTITVSSSAFLAQHEFQNEKEPSLNSASLEGNNLTMKVMVTKPNGKKEDLLLQKNGDLLQATYNAKELGVYGFTNPQASIRYAIVGPLNPKELQDLLATSERLAPLIEETKGGVFWIKDTPRPAVRVVSSGSTFAGKNWIGVKAGNNYKVVGVKSSPILPALLAIILFLSLCVLAWWKEGKA